MMTDTAVVVFGDIIPCGKPQQAESVDVLLEPEPSSFSEETGSSLTRDYRVCSEIPPIP